MIKKILIVDDDELTLVSLEHSLKQNDYEVSRAKSVAEALEVLDKERIDLVVSDIMMPNVSGLGFLSLLKNFYFDRIPVIVISSLDKGDVVTNSLGMGADYFLPKPVDSAELMKCIKNIEERSETNTSPI